MIRSILLGVLLVLSSFAALTSAKADPPRCVCVKAPCDCDRYERKIDEFYRFSNCGGATHAMVTVGTKDICTYSDVRCNESIKGQRGGHAVVVLPAVYCLPDNGECPMPTDLTNCVRSDDLSEGEQKRAKELMSHIFCSEPAAESAAPRASSRSAR